MKKVLVTYGNEAYYASIERLKQEASPLFDKVITYTNHDLPEKISKHILFSYSRGGGYWLWKPWCILSALKELEDGDILVYCDAGCKLFQHSEWGKWWKIMQTHNAIFFMYGGTMEEWCKVDCLRYFYNKYLKYYYQIQGTAIILKKEKGITKLIEEWLNIMFYNPELVIDSTEQENREQSSRYKEHRHDQAILSGLVFQYEKSLKVKILWQHMEGLFRFGQAICAARISDTGWRGGGASLYIYQYLS